MNASRLGMTLKWKPFSFGFIFSYPHTNVFVWKGYEEVGWERRYKSMWIYLVIFNFFLKLFEKRLLPHPISSDSFHIEKMRQRIVFFDSLRLSQNLCEWLPRLYESSAAVAANVCAMCCSLRLCGGFCKRNHAGSLAEKDITRARGCA
jgi:hypothetical protein